MSRRNSLLLCALLFFGELHAQLVKTIPAFPLDDQPLTIIYDASKGSGGLAGVSSVFMHAGVVTSGPDGTGWTNVVGSWGNPSSPGAMTSLGNNLWQITITPRTYFNVPPGTTIYRIGMVFREAGPCGGFQGVSTACKEGKTIDSKDIFIDMWQGGLEVRFVSPLDYSHFENTGNELNILAAASQTCTLSLYLNDQLAVQTSGTELNYLHTVTETGVVKAKIVADADGTIAIDSFEYIVRTPVVEVKRPTGIHDGINYNESDASRLTLSFLAPLKNVVYVIGDFNDWKIDPAYQMKRDGEHYWIELTGLTPGIEYAYQYLIDEVQAVADPFADKILDPNNDQYIDDTIYPSLKEYPQKASGIVSVFQTDQTPYEWQSTGYVRPAKQKLNIYELLVRDFDDPGTYQSVINRLDYLHDLGINAIELMPVMEFSGNISWGYNPIFYFAPDKAYGTKNKLKELIDKAHTRGIAVILDMVLNQADYEFPYVKMYWDNGQPSANNPWFNQQATHPFSVFFDFDHSSLYTQQFVDTVNRYWLNEYKLDGFRFDLSKGFTQKVNTDVGLWGNYDQSRIDILTRMADKIWEFDPSAYVILEHFADDSEERVLANSGMMLWGNMNYNFQQNTQGKVLQGQSLDISRTYYKNHAGSPWNNPASIVAYMESHDEERLMYGNLTNGNSVSGYSVKNLATGLERMKAAFAILFSVPGPKMIWQFGEIGYDISINQGGRTDPKPIKWNYLDLQSRLRLYKATSEILSLRNNYEVFHTSDISMFVSTDFYKYMILRSSPYTETPQSAQQMNVVVAANFDVTVQSKLITFPHAGIWYHYFSPADSLEMSGQTTNVSLQPGEFRIYTDYKLEAPEPELVQFSTPNAPTFISVTEESPYIHLNWNDNSMIEDGFRIYRRTSGEDFTSIGEVASGVSTYVDKFDLQPFKTYDYYIEAYNATSHSTSGILQITTTTAITALDPELDTKVGFYPNPTSGKLTIDGKMTSNLHLMDLNGRPISFDKINENQIDISMNMSGVYILRYISNNKLRSDKVILIKDGL